MRNTERWSNGLLYGFNYSLDCKMAKDLEEKGIGANTNDYYYLLLVCYHRYLNGGDIELDKELKYYDALREERRKWYQEALKRDTVDGKYIPSNLVDCFIELDKILSQKDLKYIRKNGTDGLHMTLGMFIRNRWQLWGGSRLKKYFIDMGGPMHPDSMSGVILNYYEEWMKGNKDAWRVWEANMKRKNNSR